MNSPTYMLLQNEGFLMQGCLKSAFAGIRTGSSAERSKFYAGWFNYSVGLERALKLILSLDHRFSEGRFPDHKVLKNVFGHDIESLYAKGEKVFPKYGVTIPDHCQLDSIDRSLLTFFSGFARLNRYFNLDALTGGGHSEDPLPQWHHLLLKIYKQDVSGIMRSSHEEQSEAFVDELKDHVVHMPGTGMDGKEQSYEESFMDDAKMPLVMPEVIWRLVKILVPIEETLCEISIRRHNRTLPACDDIPHMEEFLDFVCSDRSAISDDDWPYFD